jgi:hypothetical protein
MIDDSVNGLTVIYATFLKKKDIMSNKLVGRDCSLVDINESIIRYYIATAQAF